MTVEQEEPSRRYSKEQESRDSFIGWGNERAIKEEKHRRMVLQSQPEGAEHAEMLEIYKAGFAEGRAYERTQRTIRKAYKASTRHARRDARNFAKDVELILLRNEY